MISVTKEVTFDSAHLLSGHEGLCRNLHGHTYKVFVTVARETTELIEDGPSEGMVVDFKDLKKAIEFVITSRYDHAFVYNLYGGVAEQEIAQVVQRFNMRCVGFPGRPTAENMANEFKINLQAALCTSGIKVVKVTVYETPTSFAVAE